MVQEQVGAFHTPILIPHPHPHSTSPSSFHTPILIPHPHLHSTPSSHPAPSRLHPTSHHNLQLHHPSVYTPVPPQPAPFPPSLSTFLTPATHTFSSTVSSASPSSRCRSPPLRNSERSCPGAESQGTHWACAHDEGPYHIAGVRMRRAHARGSAVWGMSGGLVQETALIGGLGLALQTWHG